MQIVFMSLDLGSLTSQGHGLDFFALEFSFQSEVVLVFLDRSSLTTKDPVCFSPAFERPLDVKVVLESISSTFYANVFRTKVWRPKLRSWLLGLKFWRQKFCTKNVSVKRWWNWHLMFDNGRSFTSEDGLCFRFHSLKGTFQTEVIFMSDNSSAFANSDKVLLLDYVMITLQCQIILMTSDDWKRYYIAYERFGARLL